MDPVECPHPFDALVSLMLEDHDCATDVLVFARDLRALHQHAVLDTRRCSQAELTAVALWLGELLATSCVAHNRDLRSTWAAYQQAILRYAERWAVDILTADEED